ncbi:MAG TPA: MG2 domain-containing protein, partial [Kofleriaceae bacterium]
MLGRSLSISALAGLAGLALSCRGSSPISAPRSNDPLSVDSPDHLSPQQKRLAALTPVHASAGDAKLDAALDAFQARTKARRGFIAVDKPIYQPGETIWFRLFDVASADLSLTEKDVATIKLVSPRGSTVLEKKVLVSSGGAVNEFDLSGGLPGGEYTIRAETIGKTVVERRVIVASYEAPRIKKKLEFVRKAYGPGDTVTATLALHRATGEPLASRAASGTIALDGVDLPKVPIKTDAA